MLLRGKTLKSNEIPPKMDHFDTPFINHNEQVCTCDGLSKSIVFNKQLKDKKMAFCTQYIFRGGGTLRDTGKQTLFNGRDSACFENRNLTGFFGRYLLSDDRILAGAGVKVPGVLRDMTEKMMLQPSTAIGVEDGMLGRTASGSRDLQNKGRIANDSNFYINPASAPNLPFQLAIKRAIDVVGSFFGLLVLAPIILILSLAIKMESKGPVFFRQLRTGFNETPFEILKFRSMYTDLCDNSGVRQTVDNDPRITRLGRILRKTNLDELPQLWNVLIGDMSLVGPRPHVPDMLAAGRSYSELVQGYEYRHLMRPGLTGLAQARGLRGPTEHRWMAIRRIVCDVEYVRKFSLLLDLKIIMRTVLNEIKGGTGF